MKRKLSLFCAILITSLSIAQSISKTMKRLPDTGETMSYTTTLGEDNDFSINPPYFTINGNGTVTDTVTGLMWQQTDGGEMTYERAINYCDTLTLGGFTDWRLPLPHEGFSILNHQYANPAMDATVFTTTLAEYWWTSIGQANDTTKIWVTNAGGGIGNHPKSETISAGGTKKFHVRAVRDITPPPTISAHFIDNGNGTITDNLTNLIWQKAPNTDTLTWEQALNYADTLSLNAFTDWRLPNIKELQSINDESIVNSSVSNTFFPAIGINKYWSSTTLPNQTPKAWYLSTLFGITTYDLKTFRHYVLCVRGNQSTTVGINEAEISSKVVYPNPFIAFIKIKSDNSNETYEITNSLGQIIYSGKNIEQQNFSTLTNGIYFLKVADKTTSIIKLLKE